MRDEIITKMKETADDIFCHPELSMQEKYSSRRLAQFLESEGFEVCWGTGGFETAFTAEWGSGRPVIGFLAEYDALPGLAQECVPEQKGSGGPGHGCGHNLLAEIFHDINGWTAASVVRRYFSDVPVSVNSALPFKTEHAMLKSKGIVSFPLASRVNVPSCKMTCDTLPSQLPKKSIFSVPETVTLFAPGSDRTSYCISVPSVRGDDPLQNVIVSMKFSLQNFSRKCLVY